MRGPIFFLVAWTAVVLLTSFLVPGQVDTPGCMQHINPSPSCQALVTELNHRIWWTNSLPILAFQSSGYLVGAAVLIRRLRRPRG